MTVSELIERLKVFDGNIVVKYYQPEEDYDYADIQYIELKEKRHSLMEYRSWDHEPEKPLYLLLS